MINEAKMYRDHLAELQGYQVPRFHGLWEGYLPSGQGANILVTVLEYLEEDSDIGDP